MTNSNTNEDAAGTATGQYLLRPQGARLVGSYNSRVGYGQSGVPVAWQRVISPTDRPLI
jgi:type IV secretion system protein TrbI